MQNIKHPLAVRLRVWKNWMLVIGSWLLAIHRIHAQLPPQIPTSVAVQLAMQPQPLVDNSQPQNISATAEFDPPVVHVGEKSFLRVTVEATQNSIKWPEKISAPSELQFGVIARGQLMQPDGVKFHPLTASIYEVTGAMPGHFTVPEFELSAGGVRVKVPATALDVVATNVTATVAPRRLALEFSETNLFFGEPFRARVIAPAGQGNQVEALRDVQFNGGGFMTDKLSTRMTVTAINVNGQPKPAFIYEVVLTPLAAGPLVVSAQAFTVPPFSAGPVVITANGGPIALNSAAQSTPIFLASDPVQLNVRPLPEENALPGFTGAMGKFTADRPLLTTNRVRIGEPLRLKYNFNAGTNLVRYVPPQAPLSREWQIIQGKPGENVFTFIPLTDDATNTPAIPFCAFDYGVQKFYDLTIPALPVTVLGDGLPTELRAVDDAGKYSVPMKLSAAASAPGKTVERLKPLQMQGGFIFIQLLPLYGLFLLWRWDERRRFLEAHPEIARRQKAKRALRRAKKILRAAFAAGDAEKFLQHAAAAMRIAVAPHFPADDRALVGSDVLSQLAATEREGIEGATVRKIFAAVDAQFSGISFQPVSSGAAEEHTGKLPEPLRQTELLLAAEVENVLQKLEAKL
jgi:hypothetical protein